jgi:short-subunit dehydrogenase
MELSRQIAAGGHDLVLVARSADRLNRIAGELQNLYNVNVSIQQRDLSEHAGVEALWRELTGKGVSVDILVNNAGAGLHGAFGEQNVDGIGRLVTLNVAALTTLTRLALPQMLAERRGRILNVASIAAYQPGGPQEAVYYATKAYVLSFSRGLARELRRSGVTVTTLCPGPTRTSFDVSAGATDTALYRWMPVMPAAAVARAGYRGMMRGAGVVIPGAITKLMAVAGELPPRRIALEVNRLLLKSLSRAA